MYSVGAPAQTWKRRGRAACFYTILELRFDKEEARQEVVSFRQTGVAKAA
jgi:hypothetical protein